MSEKFPARKVLILAPYWGDSQHLGSVRVERYLRWLESAGVKIVLVSGGISDSIEEQYWGTWIKIQDPLGIYRGQPAVPSMAPKRRRIRRWLAYALFNPDPGILWSRRAAVHPLVFEHGASADHVISSSFPESSHVAAARLAKSLAARLVIDMRDGWLDEPMKPLLRFSPLRRFREGRLERSILRQAGVILVTSEKWRQLLNQRLPFTANRTIVLTNAYPQECKLTGAEQPHERPHEHALTLLYAGRLFTSRAERRLEHLMEPLLASLQSQPRPGSTGKLLFIGPLEQKEIQALNSWNGRFLQVGWCIETQAAIPRARILEKMREADGLLLLSSSHASIPAKLFDYLCARRPILAFAPAGSAVATLSFELRQLFMINYVNPDVDHMHGFLEACRINAPFDLPLQFEESYLRKIFLTALAIT